MASLTRWTWVPVNSRSWWWTGRPGVLQFMGSQRVGHDWATDLIWSDSCLENLRVLTASVRGPQAVGENQLQVADFFPFSADNTWFCLNLIFLRPWANHCVLLMEVFFLSHVNKLCICLGICLSSSPFGLKLKPWTDNGSTNQFVLFLEMFS